MSLWKRILNFFTGGGNKSSRSSSRSYTTSNIEKGSGYTYKDNYKQLLLRRQAEEERRRKAEEKRRREEIQKKLENTRKAQALTNRQMNNAKPYMEKQVLISKQKPIKAVENHKEWLKIAQKAVGNKDLRLEQKIGLNSKLRAADIEFSNRKRPLLSAGARGLASGALLNAPDLLMKYADKDIKKAYDKQKDNYTTGQKVADVVGNIGGTMATFGLASGGAKTVGAKATSRVAPKATSLLAKSRPIQKVATKYGLDSTKLAARVVEGLQVDLGLNLTVGNVQALIAASMENGSMGDKVKRYIKEQAVNMATGALIEVYPGAKGAAKELVRNKIVLKGAAKPLKSKAVETVKNSDVLDELVKDKADDIAKNTLPERTYVRGTSPKSSFRKSVLSDETVKAMSPEIQQVELDLSGARKPVKAEAINLFDNAPKAIDNKIDDIVRQADPVPEKTLQEKARDLNNLIDEAAETDTRNYTQFGKRLKSARKKAIGEVPEFEGTPTTVSESLEMDRLLKSKVNKDTRTMEAVGTAYDTAQHNEFRDFIKRNAIEDRYIAKVWHDEENLRKEYKYISENLDKVNKDFLDFSNGHRSIKVGDEMKREEFRVIATMDLCNQKMAENPEYYTEVFGNAVLANAKLTNPSASVMRLQQQMAQLNPAHRAKVVKKQILSLLDSSIGFRKKYGKALDSNGQATQFFDQFMNNNPAISEALENVTKAYGKEETHEAISQVFLEVNKSTPLSIGDLLMEWRYLSMLSSPKTHVRNIVGNSLFGRVMSLSDHLAHSKQLKLYKEGQIEYLERGGFDLKLSREARTNIDEVLKNGTDEGKLSAQAFLKDKAKLTSDTKFEQMYRPFGSSNANVQKVAGGVHWLSEKVGGALELEDAWALERSYRESYAKFLKANKYGTAEQTIKDNDLLFRLASEYSTEYAREATFRNYNALAEKLNALQRLATDANATAGERAAGFAANAVMPFTRTPMNVLKQGTINYSPIGLIRGQTMLKKAIQSGDTRLINEATHRLAQGQVGTGIMFLGMAANFMNPDIIQIRTNDGDNPGEKFKKNRGLQDYSIVIGNKVSISLDWLAPTSTSFFLGAEIAKTLQDALDGNGIDFNALSLESLEVLTSRFFEPTLETSMLSGINAALNDGMYQNTNSDEKVNMAWRIGQNIISNYIGSYFPSVMSALSRTLAPYDYFIAGGTTYAYSFNQNIAKIPILSNLVLPARTDPWGNISGDKGEGVERFLKTALAFGQNLISPANIKKVEWTDLDQSLYDMYKETEDDTVLPKQQYKYKLSIGKKGSGIEKEELKLTPKQMSLYNQMRAKGGSDAMEAALESIMFNRYTKDSRGWKTPLPGSKTKEQKNALISEFSGKSTEDVLNWVQKQPEYKNASKAEQTKLVKTVLNSPNTSKGNKKTSEKAVWIAQGKDPVEYDFKTELPIKAQAKVLNAGIPLDMAVDIYRNASKQSWSENEDGGSVSSTLSNARLQEALDKYKGASFEEKSKLFDALKPANSKKKYGEVGKSGGRRGGYSRRGRRGGKKTKVSNATARKVPKAIKGTALTVTSTAKNHSSKAKSLKRVEAKIPLPQVKTKK